MSTFKKTTVVETDNPFTPAANVKSMRIDMGTKTISNIDNEIRISKFELIHNSNVFPVVLCH